MGKAIPLTIGTTFFAKKADANEYLRNLISKYQIGNHLNTVDTEFCINLFQHHPHFSEKIGVGLKSIEVRKDQYGNKHFQIHRTDNSNIDISWVHCINQYQE